MIAQYANIKTVFAFAAIASLCIAGVKPAHADIERGKGWVWADNPTAPNYVPSRAYQFNSTNGVNKITHRTDRLGEYQVQLPGLAAASGTVQVSAYGGNHYCKVVNWNPSGSTQLINVRCFESNGRPANGRFSLLFLKENRGSTTAWDDAYLWADQPTAGSYRPRAAYSWNSRGQANWVSRTGTGAYVAKLAGLTKPGGTVTVTAYGDGPERCHVASWHPASNSTNVNIRCFSPTGVPVDTRFVMSFMTDVAVGVRVSEDQKYSGYVWGDRTPVPSTTYQANNTNATNLMNQTGPGAYAVTFPGLKPRQSSTAIVTAYGSGSNYCNVQNWTDAQNNSTVVNVRCFTHDGTPTNNQFTLIYLTNQQALI